MDKDEACLIVVGPSVVGGRDQQLTRIPWFMLIPDQNARRYP